MRGGRCAGSKGEEKLKVDERVARCGGRDAATLGQREWQQCRSPGARQKGREVQAIVARIMKAGSGLLCRNRVGLRHVRVGVSHRPQLRDHQRQGGNDCETQPYTAIQSGHSRHLNRHLKNDAGMLAPVAQIRNCFTQISMRRGARLDAKPAHGRQIEMGPADCPKT